MRSINDTIEALRALENTLIDTQCEITDKEREALVCAVFSTIIEAEVKVEAEKGVSANV